jgi:hypothetical protein
MMTEPSQRAKETAHERAWQRRLLPLMAGMLIVAAIYFGATSIFELRDLYSRVEQRPMDIEAPFAAFEKAAPPAALADAAYLRFKVLAMLEADALHRRYTQANSTMLARVWTRQLGFVTGMILAFVGAAFILGRLRDDGTTVEGEAEGVKAALATSSPGIVMAFPGTVLMALTIWIPFGVETRDVNTYLRSTAMPVALPPPMDINTREEALFGPGAGNPASPQPEEKPK